MSTELGKQILGAIKTYVATHVERVLVRVDQLAASLEQLQTMVRSLPEPQKGERGEPGIDGHTPTSEELRALILPLIPEPIPGPPGAPGAPGEHGAKGNSPSTDDLLAIIQPLIPAPIPGKDGERGERGPPGADGHTPTTEELRSIVEQLIPAPIAGDRGKDGANGQDGRDGADGRDAVQLEILPTIEEARSYPRGTYARHAGGLWRSFESTLGMRGWECIVEGIAEETETMHEDGRTIVRRTIYSSGRVFERSFSMAVVLDKGVFKADTRYAPGDAVTWAGSVWIAQHRTDGAAYGKPGTPASGWRLAVKAGRDARL